jgi:hypothetical protein
MANTTNFGWETPDDTDLVKDGAAAIRTLGSAIDTSLVDLKGGTTGQVLAKASNTDMDFTWATDASGIPATIFDAKGDIIAASAADTAARLAVGTNGQYLSANSSTSTGLEWVTLSSGSMTLLSTTSLAGVSTVTISSISQDYNHLQILVEDFDFASNDKNMSIRFNGDTGSNYWTTFDSANTNTFSTSGEFGNHSNINEGNFISAEIPFYTNSSIFKICTQNAAVVSSTGATWRTAQSGRMVAWKATPAAITSITIFNSTDGTNFDAGSIKIYGVK